MEKVHVHVQNLTIDQHQSNVQLGLGEAQAQPPNDVAAPSNWTGIGLFALLF